MKAFPPLVFFLLCFICGTAANAESAPPVMAPNFLLQSPSLPASLADLKGKVVYVDFWASWCKPCRKSFPWMNAMQQKYAGKFQVIAINLDSEQHLAADFLSKVPASMPIVYDPEGVIAKQYQLLGMPSSYLIDKKGHIRVAHKGFFSERSSQYEQEILTLIEESE
jgi:thiol-disulfide isomerase/thioredoxin